MRPRGFSLFLALLFWAACNLVATAAVAAVPTSGLEAFGSAVSDDELAEMRGKFVTPQGVAYFGIEMQTSWQQPDGITTQARLAVNVDFAAGGETAGSAIPQVLVSWSRDEGDSAMDVAGSGETTSGSNVAVSHSGLIAVGGLDTVHGSVQSLQIAGTDNHVRNAMTIAVVPASSPRPDTGGMTQVTEGSTLRFADGDAVTFILADNEVGLVLTSGESDAVRQSVSGNLNQLAQHVLVNSDFNDIASSMNITVGFDPASQASQLNATNAINAMRAFGF